MTDAARGFSPVDAPSLVDVTADRIRSEIASGGYQPSERLVERKLASALGASTIVIREALIRLAAEGLVLRIPRRGAIVAPTWEKSVRDQTRTRRALEELVTELAAERWTVDVSRQAWTLVEQLRRSLDALDWPQFSKLDREFHALRWRTADNDALTECAEGLYRRYVAQISQVVLASPRIGEPPDPEGTIYSGWVEALDAGDVDRAKAVVRRHVEINAEVIVGQLRIARDQSGSDGHPGGAPSRSPSP